ncbi:hypothetical protein BCY75_01855 [Latilactobacillus curvatus]|nr:hypothetical protein BCY75_01855 [Latilactobacillus curvatus]BBE26936.1 hypothetical protein NFHkm12_17620 [Latilactobacillus curvatus]
MINLFLKYNQKAPDFCQGLFLRYVQAFRHEYDFVQQRINAGYINQSIAGVLYTEINQAQLLQLQQFQGTETRVAKAKALLLGFVIN